LSTFDRPALSCLGATIGRIVQYPYTDLAFFTFYRLRVNGYVAVGLIAIPVDANMLMRNVWEAGADSAKTACPLVVSL